MSGFNQQYNQPSSCFGLFNDGTLSGVSSVQWTDYTQEKDDQLTFENQQKKQEIDSMLSQAMNGLSFEERQKHQEKLHGVDNDIVEDETVLRNALEELDLHLLLTKDGSIYEIAEQIDPGYVGSKAFRRMFLRAYDYDAKASADMMLRFFELKHNLFGKEKLAKDITMADLTDDDIACLKSGSLQLLGKDRSGRQVMFAFLSQMGDIKSTETLQSQMRAHYFVTMRALQSEETQLKGVVPIWYVLGDFESQSFTREYTQLLEAAKALPQRPEALHICVNDMYQYILLSSMIKMLKSKVRVRVRIHFGSQIECRNQLSTFGILHQSLPLDANGKLDVRLHLDWVQSCAIEEKAAFSETSPRASNVPTITPNANDVIFTGCKVVNRPGNQLFEALIKDYSEVYNYSPAKRRIVDDIISKIQDQGGRFLKPTTSSSPLWEEVPLHELRKKVMQAFRNLRRKRTKS